MLKCMQKGGRNNARMEIQYIKRYLDSLFLEEVEALKSSELSTQTSRENGDYVRLIGNSSDISMNMKKKQEKLYNSFSFCI